MLRDSCEQGLCGTADAGSPHCSISDHRAEPVERASSLDQGEELSVEQHPQFAAPLVVVDLTFEVEQFYGPIVLDGQAVAGAGCDQAKR